VSRFRPNVLLDVGDAFPGASAPELGWIGATISLGEAVVQVRSPTLRCSMPARAQPLLGIDAEPAMTRALVQHASRLLGVNAVVVHPGTMRVGDPISIRDIPPIPEEDAT
jgi:uncharacterized protein YcbX